MLKTVNLMMLLAFCLGNSGCASKPDEESLSPQEEDLAAATAYLAENPDDLDALIWVGRRLGYLRRYAEAVEIYTEGLRRWKDEPQLLRHRGHRYLSLRRFDLAERDLRLASEVTSRRPDAIEPDGIPNSLNIPTSTLHTNIYYHLGLAHFYQRRWSRAALAFEECLSRSTRDDMRVAAANWAALSFFRADDVPSGARILKSIAGSIHIIENTDYDDLCKLQLGQMDPSDVMASLSGGIGLATKGYGLSAFFQRIGAEIERGDLLRRIVSSTPQSSFGHIAAEMDLSHMDAEDLPPGHSLFLAGRRFPVTAPVKSYQQGSYDATRETCWFVSDRILPSRPSRGCNTPTRLGTRGVDDPERKLRVEENGWTVADAQAQIDQFVIHFDVCVTSQRCFQVLHDIRGLSVHFMLDVDGTIYQTCDMTVRARHAGTANDRSIGIEIAHIGAYSEAEESWRKYYSLRPDGRFDLVIPQAFGPPDGGPFTTSRKGEFRGTINTQPLVQVDYTEEQYQSLTALIDALEIALPRIRRDMPRDENGGMLRRPFDSQELRSYRGMLGHHHVTSRKTDPGPSFDWLRILRLKE